MGSFYWLHPRCTWSGTDSRNFFFDVLGWYKVVSANGFLRGSVFDLLTLESQDAPAMWPPLPPPCFSQSLRPLQGFSLPQPG